MRSGCRVVVSTGLCFGTCRRKGLERALMVGALKEPEQRKREKEGLPLSLDGRSLEKRDLVGIDGLN